VVAVRIDQPDSGDDHADTPDAPDTTGAANTSDARDGPVASDADTERQARIARIIEHRATVDDTYRTYAIDQAYERVRDVERSTVTPAMKSIEAQDAGRHLAGLENRLKGRDRLAEKVNKAMTERARTVDQAVATIKDAIRYTFCYSDDRYTEGVYADCERVERAGFKHVDRRNSWDAEEYKGINSRWRVPGSGQLFEIQFHTQASLDAKEDTHWAYEKLRDPATSKAEQESLSAYQREMTSHIPIPPGALDIPGYP
jgi:hypothetical protein